MRNRIIRQRQGPFYFSLFMILLFMILFLMILCRSFSFAQRGTVSATRNPTVSRQAVGLVCPR
jgi:hypothetical protein